MIQTRHQQIMEILSQQPTASVADLSEELAVSAVTIRADLAQLAADGQVIRTHGGARLAKERKRQEQSFATRQQMNAEQKRRIGRLAASLVEPNESILLDASTTAVAVGQALKEMQQLDNITVVTTGIWTALELLGAPHINVVLSGGQVRNTSGSISGVITHEILNRFNFNKAFLGGWGIDLKEGLTDSPLMEVELKRLIIKNSREVIAVVDGSKFGRLGLASFAAPHEITRIVTDETAPAADLDAFAALGVAVCVPERVN
jgi:DeoR/GlpR family transcriptional regulator of sugar metabolism